MNELSVIFNTFDSISLKDADAFSLKDRKDTKFIFHSRLLPSLLKEASELYNLMLVNDNPQSLYKTLYFDTPDMRFYHAHHNGKKNRYKVRYRKYLDTEDVFLEVKFKSNKGNTIKKRIKQDDIFQSLPNDTEYFLDEYTPVSKDQLKGLFYSTFKRTTLIHKYSMERVTLDVDLKYFNEDFERSIDQLAIAEVKTERFSNSSDFMKILRSNHIHPSKISKYCTGTALYMPGIKQNRFKKRFLKIKKITHDS